MRAWGMAGLVFFMIWPSAHAGPLLLPAEGPDAPGIGLPVATIEAIPSFLHSGDFRHTVTIATPTVPWNRVILLLHSWPNGDPWDRTYKVGLGNSEVMHGTTPRAEFTDTEDVTEYGSLLRGEAAIVWSHVDSWVCCGIYMNVTLQFFDDPTAPAQAHEFGAIHSPFTETVFGGPSMQTRTYDFGPVPPISGTVEFFTSGHSPAGEFWWGRLPSTQEFPRWLIYIDGYHVGTVHAMPYLYALAGFCCGTPWHEVNTLMWGPLTWTQEAAGVHVVSGEIPPYRAEIPRDVLPLLDGARNVELVMEVHSGYWPTSLNFLLDY